MDLRELVAGRRAAGSRVDYVVVDEAQFLDPDQVEQLADLVDEASVDVYAFGISTDFRGRLFPGSQRLLELADSVQQLQVEVLCWCGRPGRLNARWSAAGSSEPATPCWSPTPAARPRCTTRCCAGRTTAAATSGPTFGRPGNSRSVKSSLRTATTWACRPSFRAGVHAG
jgi:thymidine kinase